MSNPRSEHWRPYLDRYEVSSLGFVRVLEASQAGPAGRTLLPSWCKGTPSYFVAPRRTGSTRTTTVSSIMREVWDAHAFRLSESQVKAMRAEVARRNERLGVAPSARRSRETWSGFAPRIMAAPQCPFATMQTLCPDYPSWDCAAMDPLSNRMESGVWVDMPRSSSSRRAA